ncbi:large ribosomal subunit protein bL20m isoform X2 [Erinaceus europaeus]|uniref:Large ribosomal subunit protein bL20m isoform X2 n=1 Tax=Erinaceus europaeus TaxID=9365 RepID=A0ABM3Y437_ERIEU|nr:large ribosomal subunit protein bL20m isoform X2 [Erinaceus europaeus]
MVFLTAQLWLRNRVTDRYWRIQEVLKHARHFRGRKNRCYRLAVRAVTRAFVNCTKARKLKKRNLRTLWINRITAASQEHGLKYSTFITNLIKLLLMSSLLERTERNGERRGRQRGGEKETHLQTCFTACEAIPLQVGILTRVLAFYAT